MRRVAVCVVMLFVCMVFAGEAMAESSHRIGGGVHYWRTMDDVDIDEVDESGMAYILSYQYAPAPLLTLEIDLEIFPEDFGGATETVYAPQGLLVLGSTIYAGIGVGAFFADGGFAEDPFYLIRAGLDLELLPNISFDINASYHFTEFDDINNLDHKVDTDTITLGVGVRIKM